MIICLLAILIAKQLWSGFIEGMCEVGVSYIVDFWAKFYGLREELGGECFPAQAFRGNEFIQRKSLTKRFAIFLALNKMRFLSFF